MRGRVFDVGLRIGLMVRERERERKSPCCAAVV